MVVTMDIDLRNLLLRDNPKRKNKASKKDSDYQHFIQQIANLTPCLIAVYNVNSGEYIYINKAIKSILGYESSEWIGGGLNHVVSLVHPDDLPHIMEQNSRALIQANSSIQTDDPILSFEYRMRHRDGSWKWLHTFGTIFDRDPTGKVLHVINVSLDITERRETEERLRKAEEKLRIMNNELEKKIHERTKELRESETRLKEAQRVAHLGNWEYDIPSGKIMWSEEVFRIHGFDPSEGEPQYDQFLKLFSKPDLLTEHVNRAIKQGIPYELDLEIKRKDGTTRHIQAIGRPVMNEEGECLKLYGATIDITERKELEKRKDDFINMASHELKTPLTSMNIFIDVLAKQLSKENEQARYYAQRIKDQILKLKELGDNMLDVSRIRTGKLILNKERFRLDEAVRSVVEMVQVESSTHTIRILDSEPLFVTADKERICQVLINLLTNAVKYSPDSKEIIVQIERHEKEVKVTVQDFGIGIPDNVLGRVFEKLYQVPELRDKTFPGLGLGLYISKEIITNHNGSIGVESKKGSGSKFYFTLPID